MILCGFEIDDNFIVLIGMMGWKIGAELREIEIWCYELSLWVKVVILENRIVLVLRLGHVHVLGSKSLKIENICHDELEAWLY